jgi:hypothetical protein
MCLALSHLRNDSARPFANANVREREVESVLPVDLDVSGCSLEFFTFVANEVTG